MEAGIEGCPPLPGHPLPYSAVVTLTSIRDTEELPKTARAERGGVVVLAEEWDAAVVFNAW